MSDIIEKMMKDVGSWSERVASKTNEYVQSAISKGEKLTQKGKIQIEIEFTKRDYNKKLKEFGEYIFEKSEEGTSDFSMDPEFIKFSELLLSYKKVIKKLNEDINAINTKEIIS